LRWLWYLLEIWKQNRKKRDQLNFLRIIIWQIWRVFLQLFFLCLNSTQKWPTFIQKRAKLVLFSILSTKTVINNDFQACKICLTFWEIFKILFKDWLRRFRRRYDAISNCTSLATNDDLAGSHFHSGSWNLKNYEHAGEPKVELRRGWSPHEHQVASDPQGSHFLPLWLGLCRRRHGFRRGKVWVAKENNCDIPFINKIQ